MFHKIVHLIQSAGTLATQKGKGFGWIVSLFLLQILMGCSVTRHVPEDKSVLSRVRIEEDGRLTNNSRLRMAVAQNAYHRTFGVLPMSTLP